MAPSLRQRLVRGGAWVLVGKAFTALAGLLIPVLLADHLLTKEEFGAYGTAFRLVIISAVVGQLGLQHAVVRLVAESIGLGQPGRARQAVRRVYRLAIPGILGVAAILAMGGGVWLATRLWDSPLLAGTMGAVAAWAAVLGLQTLNSETFRGFQDLRLASSRLSRDSSGAIATHGPKCRLGPDPKRTCQTSFCSAAMESTSSCGCIGSTSPVPSGRWPHECAQHPSPLDCGARGLGLR